MKKRIGNDYPIEIEVTRNGQPEDFSYVTTLSVVLKSCFGAILPFEYIVEGNVIKGVFWGKDQHQTGSYLIELVENNGIKGMASLDAELITLVDHTYKESDVDETGLNVNFDIVPEGVSMGATITAAKNGLSAYELAVLDGFVGTLSEWLESLHGRDGVDGIDGKDGKDGKDGEDGSIGPVGPKGEDGFSPRVSTISLEGGVALNIIDKDGSHLFRVYNGKDGNKGDKGDKGEKGDTGNKGEKGDKGDKGDPGPQGPVGPKGEDGVLVETDPTVPSWAKQPTKPSYTAQEVGAIPDTTKVVTYTEEGSGTVPSLEYATKSDLATKVDKVSGKGLSTNDYTTAEKQKLAGLSSYDDTELRGLINGKYSKPSGGIPKSDLSSDVQATLNKVDALYDDYSTALNLI